MTIVYYLTMPNFKDLFSSYVSSYNIMLTRLNGGGHMEYWLFALRLLCATQLKIQKRLFHHI